LLAAPLALSAVLLATWIAGGRQPLDRTFAGDAILATLPPFTLTGSALSALRSSSARALVLPTPIMMWLLLSVPRKAETLWYWWVLAHLATLVLFGACWRGNRRIAACAAVCCGASTLFVQLAGIMAT